MDAKNNSIFVFISKNLSFLTLIWVGFLGVRFEVGEGGVKLTPPPPLYPKLVRIMLETWNLVRK